jgi:hypothetical protein
MLCLSCVLRSVAILDSHAKISSLLDENRITECREAIYRTEESGNLCHSGIMQ